MLQKLCAWTSVDLVWLCPYNGCIASVYNAIAKSSDISSTVHYPTRDLLRRLD